MTGTLREREREFGGDGGDVSTVLVRLGGEGVKKGKNGTVYTMVMAV